MAPAGLPVVGRVRISAANPTARAATVGLNYWQWAPTFGNDLVGTEPAALALAPSFLRVGGHNNDNNLPDPFTHAEIDRAVAYARAVGAEVILQVPLLADEAGAPPSAATAAAMVTYTNVTKQYGIKFFCFGNEPDLYPDQETGLAAYRPADFCARAREYVTAIKAVDPTVRIVGPDLSWKYQRGQPANDWMTPILTSCGDLFDVVSFHRYPFAPGAATAVAARADAPVFRDVVSTVRAIMAATGQGQKPLALTETNITYDGTPAKSTLDASPGTVAAALWTADMLGTAIDEGLWATLLWSVSEGWTLGLIPAGSQVPRPAYHALRAFAEHTGPSLLEVVAQPSGVRAYASRDQATATSKVIVVNWNETSAVITFAFDGASSGDGAIPPPVTFTFGARTFSAVEWPDAGTAKGWTYGATQLAAGSGLASIDASAASDAP